MTEQRNDLLSVGEESGDTSSKTRRLSIKPGGRRKSTFKQLASTSTSIANARRLTKALLSELPEDQSAMKPKVKMENTYRMKPDETNIFSPWKVKQAVEKIFDDNLNGVNYDTALCGKLCCELSQQIRGRVKNMDFYRYKIVCNVIMGQCSEQGLEIASRALWDAKTDNYTCVTYKNKTLFALAMIHGLFFE